MALKFSDNHPQTEENSYFIFSAYLFSVFLFSMGESCSCSFLAYCKALSWTVCNRRACVPELACHSLFTASPFHHVSFQYRNGDTGHSISIWQDKKSVNLLNRFLLFGGELLLLFCTGLSLWLVKRMWIIYPPERGIHLVTERLHVPVAIT